MYTTKMNQIRAIICASLFLPASMLASALTGLYFKSANPSNVDITTGLAYLRQQLVAALVVGLVVIGLSIFFSYRTSKYEGPKTAKLPLLVLSFGLVLTICLAITNWQVSQVQDRYKSSSLR